MQQSPRVSIVIPLYNRVELIRETLVSIKTQTYAHWEAIVIDDGSTDGSFELVKQLAQEESRILLFKRDQLPAGAPTCRNLGAKKATGKYLVFLDSDDLLAPYCLEQRIAAFKEKPAHDFLVFPMLLFYQQPGDTNILWNMATEENDLNRFLRIDGVWQTTGPIYNRAAFLHKLKGFKEGLSFWQDFELHTRSLILGLSYVKCYTYEPDCYLRRHVANSISQRGLHSMGQLMKKVEIYCNLLSLALAKGKIDSNIRQTVAATLLHFARVFVVDHQNIEQSFKVWNFANTAKIANKIYYMLGNFHLKYKYLHLKTKKNYSINLLLEKFFSLFLKKYKQRKSTLCKVKIDRPYA